MVLRIRADKHLGVTEPGMPYYGLTLAKLIWRNAANIRWKDANGNEESQASGSHLRQFGPFASAHPGESSIAM
jgi:hypothetical protein